LFIQDRGNAGLDELQTQAFAMMVKANQTPGLANNLTTFRANVPQLWLDVDRVKAKSMDVPLSNIFGTLQTYLGSTYVNDLTLFGRTYRVTAQADSQFRLSPDDIRLLQQRDLHFPALRSVRFSAALGTLRELVVATRNHFDCPHVLVQFDLRCLATFDGEQHLYPDRVHCAGWTRL